MNKDFLDKLMTTFNNESKDRLQKISDVLLLLDNNKDPEFVVQQIEIIFREVHSLKSSARAINFKTVEDVCQSLEDILAQWKQNRTVPSARQLDIIHKTNDYIIKLIIGGIQTKVNEDEIKLIKDDLQKINSISRELHSTHMTKDYEAEDKKPTTIIIPPDSLETIRVASSKLDTLFVQAEEMLSIKINLIKNINSISDLNAYLIHLKKQYLSVEKERSDFKRFVKEKEASKPPSKEPLKRILEFIDEQEAALMELSFKINNYAHGLDQNMHVFTTQLDSLLDNTKKILMLPFSTLLKTFPKMVRDMSRALGKEIHFTIEGGDIEIDKRILEEMKDVLLHLIRNAIDHGIEDPKERQNLHKASAGNLSLVLQQISGNQIQLTLTDDGSGIDLEAVKRSAIKQGLLQAGDAENLSEEAIIELIFHSGVSTSPILTDLSGRGLGMAIIREKIEKISGHLSIHSTPKEGTTITIQLPLMIATFKGTIVKISEQPFIIPTVNLERTFRIRSENITLVENRETILYKGKTTSLVWLGDILSIPRMKQDKEYLLVVIIAMGDKKVAFVVDDILHEQEIIVKNFQKPLTIIRNIAAASILENGQPIPIINVSDLLYSVQHKAYHSKFTSHEESAGEAPKHILLVEDSITTRMVLKNIFELSGFQVTACADGLEAWSAIKNQVFSAVVSDVDMPKMDGFELTEKIRKDDTISHLPIILVTARESTEDRTKGIDVGANAYITKSSFEGNALIDVVERLLI